MLSKFVPVILPAATLWAQAQERRILKHGIPLNKENLRAARIMGVRYPEKIRVLMVRHVPMPGDPILKWAAARFGVFSFEAAGMSLRYGIYVKAEYWGHRQLIAHECVHTAQYERLGGFRPFLKRYLKECLELGYASSPLELEAHYRSEAER